MQIPKNPKAFFLADDGSTYPDYLICSGVLPSDLQGKPCPYSVGGHIPDPVPLDQTDPNYTIDKGEPGDLCPPCVKQKLSSLGHWQGHGNANFPPELLPLRLFKCWQWFWLVIPGLHDSNPQEITLDTDD